MAGVGQSEPDVSAKEALQAGEAKCTPARDASSSLSSDTVWVEEGGDEVLSDSAAATGQATIEAVASMDGDDEAKEDKSMGIFAIFKSYNRVPEVTQGKKDEGAGKGAGKRRRQSFGKTQAIKEATTSEKI